jgi:hypothetical protein
VEVLVFPSPGEAWTRVRARAANYFLFTLLSFCFTIIFSYPVTLLWFPVLFPSFAYVVSSLLSRLLFMGSNGENFYTFAIVLFLSILHFLYLFMVDNHSALSSSWLLWLVLQFKFLISFPLDKCPEEAVLNCMIFCFYQYGDTIEVCPYFFHKGEPH